MLVVVYLRDARCHTVVPEEFIFALVERSLKNRGLNSNQNRRIYFSREVFEKLQRNEVIEDYIPNFNLPVTEIYPLPNDLEETCFIGRMICFEGKFFK